MHGLVRNQIPLEVRVMLTCYQGGSVTANGCQQCITALKAWYVDVCISISALLVKLRSYQNLSGTYKYTTTKLWNRFVYIATVVPT